MCAFLGEGTIIDSEWPLPKNNKVGPAIARQVLLETATGAPWSSSLGGWVWWTAIQLCHKASNTYDLCVGWCLWGLSYAWLDFQKRYLMQPPFTHALVFSIIVLMAPSTTKKTNPKPITPPPCKQRCGGGSTVKTMKFLAWHPPARHQHSKSRPW